MVAAILAHQGGWDESLFVIGPLVLIVFLLRTAKRRAEANAQATPPVPPPVEPPDA